MKFLFNSKNGKLYKALIFIFFSIVFTCLYIFTSFPVFNKIVYSTESSDKNIPAISASDSVKLISSSKNIIPADKTGIAKINLTFEKPVRPEISDYVVIYMKAENSKGIAYPAGSIAINLDMQDADTKPFSAYQERSGIYIDGLSHNYYIPLGENKYYTNFPPEILDLGDKNTGRIESISSLTLEIPEINGINIEITKIEVKNRTFFALDSKINYFIKNYFKISYTNRYQTPAYLFLVLLLVLYFLYFMLFQIDFKKHNKKPLTVLTIIVIALTALTTVYFMGTNVLYTVKSHWDSYRKYILEGRLDQTFYGFYNFEKFIAWLDENIPAGENLIVPLRGEPVYIMAEMAYNLYPRDIKFLNISGKSQQEVINEILQFKNIKTTRDNKSGSCSGSPDDNMEKMGYQYVIFLSRSDAFYFKELQFINKYRKTGGYIYKLN